MTKIHVVAENVLPSEINSKEITSDCHLVTRVDGVVDLVRAYKMTDIFDVYHDLGIQILRIQLSGGSLNPKSISFAK